jgi:hypothetical protein
VCALIRRLCCWCLWFWWQNSILKQATQKHTTRTPPHSLDSVSHSLTWFASSHAAALCCRFVVFVQNVFEQVGPHDCSRVRKTGKAETQTGDKKGTARNSEEQQRRQQRGQKTLGEIHLGKTSQKHLSCPLIMYPRVLFGVVQPSIVRPCSYTNMVHDIIYYACTEDLQCALGVCILSSR